MDCLSTLPIEQYSNDMAKAHVTRIDALTIDKDRDVACVRNMSTVDDYAAEAGDRANDAGATDPMIFTTDDGLTGTSDAVIVGSSPFRGVRRQRRRQAGDSQQELTSQKNRRLHSSLSPPPDSTGLSFACMT
jgi:hypothetical protein